MIKRPSRALSASMAFFSLFVLSDKAVSVESTCRSEANWWPICGLSEPGSFEDTYTWLTLFKLENNEDSNISGLRRDLEIFKPGLSHSFYLYEDARLSCTGRLGDTANRNCLIGKMKVAADAGNGDAAYTYFQLTTPSEDSRKYLLLSAELGSYAGRLIVGMELIENGKTHEERIKGIEYYESLTSERLELIHSLVKFKSKVSTDVPHERVLVWDLLSELNSHHPKTQVIENIVKDVKYWPIFCSTLERLARGEQIASKPENMTPDLTRKIVEITLKCVETK